MTNTEKHLKRAEVPEASTWDLTAIFPTDAAFEKELDELAGAVPFIRALQGTIGSSSQALLTGLGEGVASTQKLGRVNVYSHLTTDQDPSGSTYHTLQDKACSLLTQVSEAPS